MLLRVVVSSLLLFASLGKLAAQCDGSSETHARLLQATAKPLRVETLSAHTQPLQVTQPARLLGAVAALGDGSSGIKVWVFSGDQVIFESGLLELVCVDVTLQPGQYTLVYDNSSSLFTSKTVWSSVHLEDDRKAQPREPAPVDESIRTTMTRRRLAAIEVARSLNAAYRDLVRELAIQQPSRAPQATVESGVYDFAELNPTLYRDILAASIAHSMAHNLHAASKSAPYDDEGASLWREVNAAGSARVEPDIDRLTVAILCRSGYGSTGLFTMMKRLDRQTNASEQRARIDSIRQMPACTVKQAGNAATILHTRR